MAGVSPSKGYVPKYLIVFIRRWIACDWCPCIDEDVFWRTEWKQPEDKEYFRPHLTKLKLKLIAKFQTIDEALQHSMPYSAQTTEIDLLNRLLADLAADLNLFWRAVLTRTEIGEKLGPEAYFGISEGGNILRYWIREAVEDVDTAHVDSLTFRFKRRQKLWAYLRIGFGPLLLPILILFVSFLDQWRSVVTGDRDDGKIINNVIVFSVLIFVAAGDSGLRVKETVARNEQSYNLALSEFIKLQGWAITMYNKSRCIRGMSTQYDVHPDDSGDQRGDRVGSTVSLASGNVSSSSSMSHDGKGEDEYL